MLKWVCIAPHYLPGYFVEAYYSMFPVIFKLQKRLLSEAKEFHVKYM